MIVTSDCVMSREGHTAEHAARAASPRDPSASGVSGIARRSAPGSLLRPGTRGIRPLSSPFSDVSVLSPGSQPRSMTVMSRLDDLESGRSMDVEIELPLRDVSGSPIPEEERSGTNPTPLASAIRHSPSSLATRSRPADLARRSGVLTGGYVARPEAASSSPKGRAVLQAAGSKSPYSPGGGRIAGLPLTRSYVSLPVTTTSSGRYIPPPPSPHTTSGRDPLLSGTDPVSGLPPQPSTGYPVVTSYHPASSDIRLAQGLPPASGVPVHQQHPALGDTSGDPASAFQRDHFRLAASGSGWAIPSGVPPLTAAAGRSVPTLLASRTGPPHTPLPPIPVPVTSPWGSSCLPVDLTRTSGLFSASGLRVPVPAYTELSAVPVRASGFPLPVPAATGSSAPPASSRLRFPPTHPLPPDVLRPDVRPSHSQLSVSWILQQLQDSSAQIQALTRAVHALSDPSATSTSTVPVSASAVPPLPNLDGVGGPSSFDRLIPCSSDVSVASSAEPDVVPASYPEVLARLYTLFPDMEPPPKVGSTFLNTLTGCRQITSHVNSLPPSTAIGDTASLMHHAFSAGSSLADRSALKRAVFRPSSSGPFPVDLKSASAYKIHNSPWFVDSAAELERDFVSFTSDHRLPAKKDVVFSHRQITHLEHTARAGVAMASHLDWFLNGIHQLMVNLSETLHDGQASMSQGDISAVTDFLSAAAGATSDLMASHAYMASMLVHQRRLQYMSALPSWTPDLIKRRLREQSPASSSVFGGVLPSLIPEMDQARQNERLRAATSSGSRKRPSSSPASGPPASKRPAPAPTSRSRRGGGGGGGSPICTPCIVLDSRSLTTPQVPVCSTGSVLGVPAMRLPLLHGGIWHYRNFRFRQIPASPWAEGFGFFGEIGLSFTRTRGSSILCVTGIVCSSVGLRH